MEDDKILHEDVVGGNGEDFNEGVCEEPTDSSFTAEVRNVSYYFLFFAAVFVVNALETGSYRTPWPVAVIVSLIGFGLFGYSCVKNKDALRGSSKSGC